MSVAAITMFHSVPTVVTSRASASGTVNHSGSSR